MDQKTYTEKVKALEATITDPRLLKKRIRQLTRRFNRSQDEENHFPKGVNGDGGRPLLPEEKANRKNRTKANPNSPTVPLESFDKYLERLKEFYSGAGLVFEQEMPLITSDDAWSDDDPLGGDWPTYWSIDLKSAWERDVELQWVLDNYRTRWGFNATHFTIANLPGPHLCFRTQDKDLRTATPRSA